MVYQVKPGDSLSKIAQEKYGDPMLWKVLHSANPSIDNPNFILPGQSIILPEIATLVPAGSGGGSLDPLEPAGATMMVTDKKKMRWIPWVLLALAAGGGYAYYRSKKKIRKPKTRKPAKKTK